LSEAELALGEQHLKAGENAPAIAAYKASVDDAPEPIPASLFDDKLANVPAILYFSGERDEAIDLANVIERKADPQQLIAIAAFYIMIESGTEAKRIAEAAIAKSPDAAGYQMLALAERVNFQLEDSAAAYEKAVELDPKSVVARRGLAEAKRSLGKSADAEAIYRSILADDPSNLAARTGLVMSLFEGGKQSDGEAELAAALDANSGNVMLLAGVGYWYAAHGDGDKAVEYGTQAIRSDPRFIWSYLAIARGYMLKNDAESAEKALLSARRYGNFPTLEYELASARLKSGFYREAVEGLLSSFTIRDGRIATKLGGRIEREDDNFTDLVSYERRASIFAPTAADNAANADELRALLEIWLATSGDKPDAEAATAAADRFVSAGEPAMKIHRQLFAASRLLSRNIAFEKVLDLTRDAAKISDGALKVGDPTLTVMADEIYAPRHDAADRGEVLRVGAVPSDTLMGIVRGRIEELAGAALIKEGKNAEGMIRLKRAIGVYPDESAWSRSAHWRLGLALDADGKTSDAFPEYLKGYKNGPVDIAKYAVIRATYYRVKGTLDGLETIAGPDPLPSRDKAEALVAKPQDPTTPMPTPEATPEMTSSQATEPTPEPTPQATPEAVAIPEPPPTVTPSASVETADEATASPTPEVTPQSTPAPTSEVGPESAPTPVSTPDGGSERPNATETQSTQTATSAPEVLPEPTAAPGDDALKRATEKKAQPEVGMVADGRRSELFPPVVITIPKTPRTSDSTLPKTDADTPKEQSEPIMPCTITFGEEPLNLMAGAELAVIVGTEDDREMASMKAVSSNAEDIDVKVVPIAGVKGRLLYVVRSISTNKGIYQVHFSMDCGSKELTVKVS